MSNEIQHPDLINKFKVENIMERITVHPGNIVSLKDAAKVLGYSYHYFLRCSDDKGMPPYFRHPVRKYYKIDDLKEWLRNLKKINPSRTRFLNTYDH